MASRALSPTRSLLLPLAAATLLGAGCGGAVSAASPAAPVFEAIDVSGVPATTVSAASPDLVLDNGRYLFEGRPYDGIVEERYADGQLKSLASYYQGRRHGPTTSFYPGGQVHEVRSYRSDLSYGRQLGYWENGRLRFDYAYLDDRREGRQRQWYRSGAPYVELTFRDDKEDGMQRAWRENGKPYINYEARDGRRYGLQKSALCSVLVDGVLQ